MKILRLTVMAICLAAPAAYAKGHDQGMTTVPGAQDVGSTTVTNAQALGGALGERPKDKGPSAGNPAAGKAGR